MQDLYQPVVRIFVYTTSRRAQTKKKKNSILQKSGRLICDTLNPDSHIAVIGMVYRSIWI